MSVILNGSTQHLTSSAVPASYPFSVSAWFKTSDLTQDGAFVDIGDGALVSAGHPHNLTYLKGSVAGDPIRAYTVNGATYGIAATSSGPSSGTWTHVLAVYNSDTDRRIYIDGESKGTDSTNVNGDQSLSVIDVGAFANGTSNFFTGNLAEVAIWTSALSDANAVSLAGGDSPTTVDSGNLTEYWTLLSDANSDGGSVGTNLSEVGSPTYDSGDQPTVGQVVSLSGNTSITFVSSANLIVGVSLAGTTGITFSSSASILLLGSITTYAADKTTRRLIAISNNRVYIEDV